MFPVFSACPRLKMTVSLTYPGMWGRGRGGDWDWASWGNAYRWSRGGSVDLSAKICAIDVLVEIMAQEPNNRITRQKTPHPPRPCTARNPDRPAFSRFRSCPAPAKLPVLRSSRLWSAPAQPRFPPEGLCAPLPFSGEVREHAVCFWFFRRVPGWK